MEDNQLKYLILAFFIGAIVLGFLNGFSKPFKCQHKNKVLRVNHSVVNCETTATFCKDCGKQLTKPKTDCR